MSNPVLITMQGPVILRIEPFREITDPITLLAAKMFNVSPYDVTPHQRTLAKSRNYFHLYASARRWK